MAQSFAAVWSCTHGCSDHTRANAYVKFDPNTEWCADGCISVERAVRQYDRQAADALPDSAIQSCYHCGNAVCLLCQRAPVRSVGMICEGPGHDQQDVCERRLKRLGQAMLPGMRRPELLTF
ncbi:hypothetical protein EV385_6654 [Krasilnikovia cinnamomea]|uniref:Uncharacterized protein n=1 Tax=Krasilnikovia cinnamomea TaxID=349313 RepID=A0A4Q7Z9W4_9ACTN|nr:hypothetical protein EV385_6654 [Krasilnikovia cinnamomea]